MRDGRRRHPEPAMPGTTPLGGPAHTRRPRHPRLPSRPPLNHPSPRPAHEIPDGAREVELLPAAFEVVGLYLSLAGDLRQPPAPGLADAVRAAERADTGSSWRLQVTAPQADSIAYALWLEARAHSTGPRTASPGNTTASTSHRPGSRDAARTGGAPQPRPARTSDAMRSSAAMPPSRANSRPALTSVFPSASDGGSSPDVGEGPSGYATVAGGGVADGTAAAFVLPSSTRWTASPGTQPSASSSGITRFATSSSGATADCRPGLRECSGVRRHTQVRRTARARRNDAGSLGETGFYYPLRPA